MTLTERILKQLEAGPSTAADVWAALPDAKRKTVIGIMYNLADRGQIVRVGHVRKRLNKRGGRREVVYTLISEWRGETPVKPVKSEPVANGEYAMAQRRTVPAYVWPAKGMRNQG